MKLTFLFTLLLLFSVLYAQEKHIRDSWHKPGITMDSIGVNNGMIIGEVGAGRGYFTFHLSNRVGPQGKIYANDILEERLNVIRKNCQKSKISNITTILGEEADPLFPTKLDMVVMMYVFHDLTQPIKFLRNAAKYLKPSATLVIIDRDPERYGNDYNHFLKKDEVIEKIIKANYKLLSVHEFLPRDNIYIAEPDTLLLK